MSDECISSDYGLIAPDDVPALVRQACADPSKVLLYDRTTYKHTCLTDWATGPFELKTVERCHMMLCTSTATKGPARVRISHEDHTVQFTDEAHLEWTRLGPFPLSMRIPNVQLSSD